MKFKIAIKLFSLSIVMLVSSSCEDFLEEDPKNLISESDIPQTIEGAESLIFGTYENWTENTSLYARWLPLLEIGTDDISSQVNYSSPVDPFITHTLSPSEQFYYQGIWGPLWNGVALSNNAIELIDQMIELPEEDRLPIIGEAHFMRALYYYHLVRIWGDVPVFLSSVNSLSKLESAQRQPVEEVYTSLIIPDLKRAVALLPGSYTSENLGRATKSSANVILAEAYLTLAGQRRSVEGDFVIGDRVYYDSARLASWEVIQNTDGLDIITEGDGTNPAYAMPWLEPFSSESLVEFGNVEGLGIGPNGEGLYLVSESMMASQNQFWGLPVQGFDGPKRGFFIPTPDMFRAFEDGDERKSWGMLTQATLTDGTVGYSNPIFRKWADPKQYTGVDGVISNDGDINYVLYRVADALLIYAEAANESNNGPTGEAYTQINRIRNRAGLVDLELNLSYEEFREAVWKERRTELHAECKRKFDLVRTGRLIELSDSRDIYYSSADNPDWLGGSAMDEILIVAPPSPYPEHEYLWPIPTDEISLNPSWSQNDGY